MEFPRIDPFGSTTSAGGAGQITLQKLVIECGQGSIFDRTVSFHLGKEGKDATLRKHRGGKRGFEGETSDRQWRWCWCSGSGSGGDGGVLDGARQKFQASLLVND
ncbi:hypothetical protein V1477_010125 [Vespula maculifrons]|uniref:Uncharacterized protein n=4 Tax=Vespula TaxID=7451 RepID=A0A834K3Y4_VESGE|nr:hypothetical protein HZH66_007639 [Vespula vulgaris]KAF7399803.1 hypothetical protein HZH68_008395 [Vespula germanica]KAF7423873.1 hypothetical protein H0235_009156 [Vespula pensylvanica]